MFSTRYDSTYPIDIWETEEGLLGDSATAIVRTSDGYLCFDTHANHFTDASLVSLVSWRTAAESSPRDLNQIGAVVNPAFRSQDAHAPELHPTSPEFNPQQASPARQGEHTQALDKRRV